MEGCGAVGGMWVIRGIVGGGTGWSGGIVGGGRVGVQGGRGAGPRHADTFNQHSSFSPQRHIIKATQEADWNYENLATPLLLSLPPHLTRLLVYLPIIQPIYVCIFFCICLLTYFPTYLPTLLLSWLPYLLICPWGNITTIHLTKLHNHFLQLPTSVPISLLTR